MKLQADVKEHTSAFVLLSKYHCDAVKLCEILNSIGRKRFTVKPYQDGWANIELVKK